MHRIMKSALLLCAIAFSGTAMSQDNGQPYQAIKPAIETANPDKVEVLEFFWFGCPHCFAFEPTINDWAASKPDHVDFVREAPPLNKGWMPHSQAFYASQAMDVQEKFFEPFFKAIHIEKRPLNSPKKIGEFAQTLGIDGKKFVKTMKSFEVDSRIRRSMVLASGAGVRSVPSIVVNGKYLTSGSMAGTNRGVVDIINKLVARERVGS